MEASVSGLELKELMSKRVSKRWLEASLAQTYANRLEKYWESLPEDKQFPDLEPRWNGREKAEAKRNYEYAEKDAIRTRGMYEEISDFFEEIFGENCGYRHTEEDIQAEKEVREENKKIDAEYLEMLKRNGRTSEVEYWENIK